jgi:hypothetical protein
VFECSIRDFFECQNVVEACCFGAFFTQFCLVFECQKLRHAELLMSCVGALVFECSIRDLVTLTIYLGIIV